MGAEAHGIFVAAAYAIALGLPAALGIWTWARGVRVRRDLTAWERKSGRTVVRTGR